MRMKVDFNNCLPPMEQFIPSHDEVHISCTFTWDLPRARELFFQWRGATDKPVKLGGASITF